MSEISEDEFRSLKEEVEKARSSAERAKGALDQLTTRLKEEFGCKSLKEAKEMLVKLEQEKASAEKAFSKAFKEYRQKWTADINDD